MFQLSPNLRQPAPCSHPVLHAGSEGSAIAEQTSQAAEEVAAAAENHIEQVQKASPIEREKV